MDAKTFFGEWISVKDRLPDRDGLEDDESEYVLVCIDYQCSYNPTGGKWVTICGYEKDGWSSWDCFGWSGGYAPHITHWMPLPEPPKGE